MIPKTIVITSLILASLGLSALTLAATPKTYQVTGEVIAVKDSVIVVKKGKELWEIERSPSTKITGDIAVGKKVTIEYRMAATDVDVKPTKEKEAPKKKS